MRILIITKVSIPAINATIPDWSSLPFDYALNDTPWTPDAIISMGVGVMNETFEAIRKYPKAKLFCYNWDCYSWVWFRPRSGEYDYKKYGELLVKSTEVWVPSYCTGVQAELWWEIPSWQIIRSSCPWWEHSNIRDDGYILCTLRKIPDRWCDKFEQACEELQLPYKRPDHKLSYVEYKDMVAGCKFLVNHYMEASTGGLTLLEGYYHGKPCLLTNSIWNGAVEYFGIRANYFEHESFESFKIALRSMYEDTPEVGEDCKEWITTNYSSTRMIADMTRRLNAFA